MKFCAKIKKIVIEICKKIKCNSSCFNDNHIEYNYTVDPPIPPIKN